MTELDYETERAERIAGAAQIIRDLFSKYEITDQSTAKRLIRETFSQEDLELYHAAKNFLMGEGAIG